jgi:hypothetical protein
VAKIFTHEYENYGKHVQQAGAVQALASRLAGLAAAGRVRPQDIVAAAYVGPRPNLSLPPELAYPRLTRRDAGIAHESAA